MRQSELFVKILREVPRGTTFVSHQMLLRGGFVYQFASGVYGLLPLGFRVLRNIENIIRQEFEEGGIQELFMPVLHPAELWKKTGRFDTAGKELLKVKGRDEQDWVLAMTHEETIAAMAAATIALESALPVIVNQFQTKIRDEERPRAGLLRLKEFVMQDAYSFDKDEKGLDKSFRRMADIYKRIFKKMELPVIPVKASAGLMGGSDSYEFMVLSDAGEDEVAFCKKCKFAANVEILKGEKRCPSCQSEMEIKKSIEVAHSFKLGTKYSKAMDILYKDKKGEQHFVQMGCYGIGLERVMATLVEAYHDEKGIIWPKEVAPFQVHLIQIGNSQKVEKMAERVYRDLSTYGGSTAGGQKQDIEVLYDDRKNNSPGEKFIEADLIGIPIRLVVSEKTLKENSLELKLRGDNKLKLIKIPNLYSQIVKFHV